MRIFLTGDTHIPIDIEKLAQNHFKVQKELTKEDYVIVLGDFGLYWHKSDTFEMWWNWLQGCPFTTLWLDGNHENFDWIDSMPVEDWHGGKVNVDGSIIHLRRGELYDIGGKKFFVCGGAASYDKVFRRPFVSWWPQEELSAADISHVRDTLARCQHIDYILTHTAPASVVKQMFDISTDTAHEEFFQSLLQEEPKVAGVEWYFGHWHEDKTYKNFHCLYNKIVELK